MKRILSFFSILTILISSCNSAFLDLTPEDQVSSASFFRTEEQFRQALATAYQPLRDVISYDYYGAEMRSDNTHYEFYSIDRGPAYLERENIADFLDVSTNSYTNNLYYQPYKGISRCNIVLDRIAGSSLSDAAKADIEGQAKFLRAWYYFKLVRYFGGVPLFLKEVRTREESYLTRSTADQVYASIIADAKDAIEKLANPVFPQSGVATKGAATMLLAEVYMTQKNYPEAEPLLRNILTMGYSLLPVYADVFKTANKNSRESIFEVQYLQGNQGQQSNFIYIFLPKCTNTTILTGVATNNTSSAGGGWNTPTKDMINAYEAGDKRKDASIAMAEGSYNASLVFTPTALKSIVNYVPPAGKIGVPFIKKYLNPHTVANNTNDNWPVYRYADALLLLAECLNERNKAGEALPYLTEVRDRAFGTGVSPVTTTDQGVLRDIIAHERRVELAFENHRWHDLVRTDKAISVMTAHAVALKAEFPYLPANSYQVDKNKLLFPIPFNERSLNPALTQNDGYTN